MASDLLEQMRRHPKADWKIADVARVCAQNGVNCDPPRGGSLHYKVSHKDMARIFTVPFGRPIKPVYIKLLVDYIDILRNLP